MLLGGGVTEGPLFAISHRSLLAASLPSVSLPLCRPSFFWLSLFPFLTSSLPICHSSLTLYSGYPEIMYVHGGLLIIEWWICYLGKCSLWKFPPLTEIKARLIVLCLSGYACTCMCMVASIPVYERERMRRSKSWKQYWLWRRIDNVRRKKRPVMAFE